MLCAGTAERRGITAVAKNASGLKKRANRRTAIAQRPEADQKAVIAPMPAADRKAAIVLRPGIARAKRQGAMPAHLREYLLLHVTVM